MADGSLVESLLRDLSTARGSGAAAVDSFFAGLAGREGNGDAVVEFALRVLESFTAEDGFLVADGCRKLLMANASAAEAGRVRAVRRALPDPGGFRDYRTDLDELVAVLEGRGKGVCDCVARSSFGPSPRERGSEISSVTPKPEVMGNLFRVRCTSCGKEWDVEEDLSYHYPHYHWRRAADTG